MKVEEANTASVKRLKLLQCSVRSKFNTDTETLHLELSDLDFNNNLSPQATNKCKNKMTINQFTTNNN